MFVVIPNIYIRFKCKLCKTHFEKLYFFQTCNDTRQYFPSPYTKRHDRAPISIYLFFNPIFLGNVYNI